jgi:hypothetical protein
LYVPLALASAVFLGPSPLGLATVFYCLRFETSLFVASYDSQGHGGGIRPRLHTGLKSKSKLEQSRALAYCRQPASTVTPGIEPRWDPWPYISSTVVSHTRLQFVASARTVWKTRLSTILLLRRYSFTCLPFRCLAMDVFSNSAVPAFISRINNILSCARDWTIYLNSYTL